MKLTRMWFALMLARICNRINKRILRQAERFDSCVGYFIGISDKLRAELEKEVHESHHTRQRNGSRKVSY